MRTVTLEGKAMAEASSIGVIAPIIAAVIIGSLALVTQAFVKIWEARQENARRKSDAAAALIESSSALGLSIKALRDVANELHASADRFEAIALIEDATERQSKSRAESRTLEMLRERRKEANAAANNQIAAEHASQARAKTLLDAITIATLKAPTQSSDAPFDHAAHQAALDNFLREARAEVRATQSIGLTYFQRTRALRKFQTQHPELPR
ncbi:hypothetical protein [uncultured Nocardioides sp.]|uniref:hypothetical protein n=1 Tax=uncultured Nocardioides sp. TaxID=198441 RepID=UPI00261C82B5|nr:hypothetical protein [uncultured Nocardioides sp.]